MKKFLLPLLFLLSYLPSQATQSSTSELQKCIGATTLLLSTLSGLRDIKDKDYTKTSLAVLKVLQKGLDNRQAARDLWYAIDKGDYKLARQLLQKKPSLDINARLSWPEHTALMQCCWKGDESIDVVKDILKHPKLDITIKNISGATCLHDACVYGTPKITNFLLKREDIGKVLHAIDNNGRTPLDSIVDQIEWSQAKIGHVTIWNMMVAKGAQLSKCKDDYKQLNSDYFESPYSDYVDIIKSNPPKKVKISQKPFLGQNTRRNQEGKIEDIRGYQHEGERKEEK